MGDESFIEFVYNFSENSQKNEKMYKVCLLFLVLIIGHHGDSSIVYLSSVLIHTHAVVFITKGLITDFSGFLSVLSFFVLSATVIVIFSNKLFGFYLFSSLIHQRFNQTKQNKTENENQFEYRKRESIVNTLAYFSLIIGFYCSTFSCSTYKIMSTFWMKSVLV